MFIAIGAGAPAIAGAQLVVHAAFKSLLFLGAGLALSLAGTGDLGRLRLGRGQRVAAVLFGIGALSLAAVPPLGGAFSKEFVLAAAAAWSPWLGAGVLIAGVPERALCRTAVRAQLRPGAPRRFCPAAGARAAHLEAVPSLGACAAAVDCPEPATSRIPLWAMGVLAAGAVLLGVLALPAAQGMLERLTGGQLAAGQGWEVAAARRVDRDGVALVWVLSRSRRLLSLGVPVRAQAQLADWLGLPSGAPAGRASPSSPSLARCGGSTTT